MLKKLVTTSLALCMLAGCGENNPPTHKVTGIVTLDDKAVEGAIITFVPADPTLNHATATSNIDGKYSLQTFVPEDGAMAGIYKVKVVKYPGGKEPEPPTAESKNDSIEDQYARFDSNYTEKDARPKGKLGATKNQLPSRYANAAESSLSATVMAEQENDIPLKLTKKKKR